VSSWRTPFAD